MNDGVEDGNIDVKGDGCTWDEVLKKTWCTINPPKNCWKEIC